MGWFVYHGSLLLLLICVLRHSLISCCFIRVRLPRMRLKSYFDAVLMIFLKMIKMMIWTGS